MSIKKTIVCDGCGQILGSNATAKDARQDAWDSGAFVALPGGRDYCARCVPNEFADRGARPC